MRSQSDHNLRAAHINGRYAVAAAFVVGGLTVLGIFLSGQCDQTDPEIPPESGVQHQTGTDVQDEATSASGTLSEETIDSEAGRQGEQPVPAEGELAAQTENGEDAKSDPGQQEQQSRGSDEPRAEATSDGEERDSEEGLQVEQADPRGEAETDTTNNDENAESQEARADAQSDSRHASDNQRAIDFATMGEETDEHVYGSVRWNLRTTERVEALTVSIVVRVVAGEYIEVGLLSPTGDYILPTARYIPVIAPSHNRWLRSSAIDFGEGLVSWILIRQADEYPDGWFELGIRVEGKDVLFPSRRVFSIATLERDQWIRTSEVTVKRLDVPSGANCPDPSLDGALIRQAGQQDVFVIKIVECKGFKRRILNERVIYAYQHLSLGDVIVVPASVVSSYRTSTLAGLARPDGRLEYFHLRRTGPDTGVRHFLHLSESELLRAGLDLDSVFVINTNELRIWQIGRDYDSVSQLGEVLEAQGQDW